MNDLPTIAHNLRTQDNRITANPIFIVQQLHRIANLEESDTYVWMDEDWNRVDDEETIARLEEAEESGAYNEEHASHVKAYYRDEYVFVQPFFTEHGANEYLKINSHNLREPRIYVESGYRNEEWELVRQHLMGAPREGWKS